MCLRKPLERFNCRFPLAGIIKYHCIEVTTKIQSTNWKIVWPDVWTMLLIKHLLHLTSHLQSYNCSVYWIATNNASSRELFSKWCEELTRTMTVQQLLPLLPLAVSLCLYQLECFITLILLTKMIEAAI